MPFNVRPLTEAEKQFLLNMKAAFKERSSKLRRQTTEIRDFMSARRRAGPEFGNELRNQVARAVGIDLGALNGRSLEEKIKVMDEVEPAVGSVTTSTKMP